MPVHFEMALQSVSQLSAVESAMVLESWWRIYWTDERLRWDPDEFGGLGTIDMGLSQNRTTGFHTLIISVVALVTHASVSLANVPQS